MGLVRLYWMNRSDLDEQPPGDGMFVQRMPFAPLLTHIWNSEMCRAKRCSTKVTFAQARSLSTRRDFWPLARRPHATSPHPEKSFLDINSPFTTLMRAIDAESAATEEAQHLADMDWP